ncbi:hypothetical protein [Streptomyces endophyticus]|uniref:Uncharacterized protein n=1 Tax=Streptomyces endophyticus TaxID=714166 RepID=A0ABU6FJ47_9ACTN|nr:hypothetical protein [Streptomyces endophyticus]MEB8344075.1 hypothetical protein [Streptomyces endophyticus]
MNVRTERPARETAEALDWLRALAERFPLLLAELAPAPASGTPRPGPSGGPAPPHTGAGPRPSP